MASQRPGVRIPSAPPLKTFLAPLALLAVTGGALALFAWAPWSSSARNQELDWLEDYAAWSQSAGGCATFDRTVGPAPTERLKRVALVARAVCDGAADRRWEVRSSLIRSRADDAPTTDEPALARAVEPLSGGPVRVHCWPASDRMPLAEDLNVVAGDEFWLAGFADPERGAIHLARGLRPAAPVLHDPLRAVPEPAEPRARPGADDAGARGRAPPRPGRGRGRRRVPRRPGRARPRPRRGPQPGLRGRARRARLGDLVPAQPPRVPHRAMPRRRASRPQSRQLHLAVTL